MKSDIEKLKEEVKENVYNAMQSLQQIDLRTNVSNLEYMLAALYSLRDAYHLLDEKEGADNASAPE